MSSQRTSEECIKLEQAAANAGPIARLDLAVIQAIEPWCDHPVVKTVGKASELADQPPLVTASALTLAAGFLTQRPLLARTGLRMLASHGLATFFKSLAKNRIDRTRPQEVANKGRHEVGPGRSKAKERRSFPSGHSAGAVAVARAVAQEHPSATAIVYPLAAAAAMVQIPRKAHFPSDVIVGSLLGLAAEALVAALFARVPLLRSRW